MRSFRRIVSPAAAAGCPGSMGVTSTTGPSTHSSSSHRPHRRRPGVAGGRRRALGGRASMVMPSASFLCAHAKRSALEGARTNGASSQSARAPNAERSMPLLISYVNAFAGSIPANSSLAKSLKPKKTRCRPSRTCAAPMRGRSPACRPRWAHSGSARRSAPLGTARRASFRACAALTSRWIGDYAAFVFAPELGSPRDGRAVPLVWACTRDEARPSALTADLSAERQRGPRRCRRHLTRGTRAARRRRWWQRRRRF